MNDDLNDKPDVELNDAFSVEVAGIQLDRSTTLGWEWPPGVKRSTAIWPKSFTTDANAVLPFTARYWMNVEAPADGYVTIHLYDGYPLTQNFRGDALAKTFARAAVVALIRAARAKKNEG